MRQLGIIEDGAVLIQNGLITNVGPTRRLENLAEARHARVIEAHGRVVMPGLIDAHVCVTAGPPRLDEFETASAIQPAASEDCWPQRYLRQTPLRTLELQARRLLQLGLRHGTTSFGVRCGLGFDEAVDMKCLKAVAAAARVIVSVHRTYLGAATPAAREAVRVRLPEMIDTGLLTMHQRCLADSIDLTPIADSLGDSHGFASAVQIRAIGMQIRLRAQAVCDGKHVASAERLGLSGLDAVQAMTQDGINAIARTDLLATILPTAPHTMSSPGLGRRLIDEGVPVAIASGFDQSASRTSSLPLALSQSCIYMGLKPAEAITAGTINAAHALGLAHRVGSLEYGKEADLLILQVGDFREMLFHAGLNLVSAVIKRGEMYSTAEELCTLTR